MKKQRGYTLIELIAVLWVLVLIGGAGFIVFIAWHFISKFW